MLVILCKHPYFILAISQLSYCCSSCMLCRDTLADTHAWTTHVRKQNKVRNDSTTILWYDIVTAVSYSQCSSGHTYVYISQDSICHKTCMGLEVGLRLCRCNSSLSSGCRIFFFIKETPFYNAYYYLSLQPFQEFVGVFWITWMEILNVYIIVYED